MITIAAVALVSLVALLFASMAIAPVLIESRTPKASSKASSKASLVLVETSADSAGSMEHSRAA